MQVSARIQQMLQDVDIIITIICGHSGTVLDTIILGRNNCDVSINSEFEQTKESTDLYKSHEQRELAKAHTDRFMLKSYYPDNLPCDCEKCILTRLCISVDPMLASCLTTELRRSRNFESSFRHIMEILTMKQAFGKVGSKSKKRSWVMAGECPTAVQCCSPWVHLQLRLHKRRAYFRMEPDIRWSNRMLPQLIQRVHMEDAFSWLSTLGGAYSSLGDNMYNCAIEAGRVAMRQLYLAERLGDALLRSRCLLYIALSSMQRGRLSAAKKLIRQQYKFATSKTDCLDTRLVSMCQGIWHHLRHHYAKRKET